MKVTLTNTTKVVELVGPDGIMPAFVTRIAAERGRDLAEFERDLQEMTPPSFDAEAWPTRMFLD